MEIGILSVISAVLGEDMVVELFVFCRSFFILNIEMIMEAKAQNAVFNRVKAVPGRKK